jgi:DNA-directed RNA polymerase specialized sigma subunit
MSFEILVKRISPTIKKIAHKLNGHYTFFNDEDLYQEALAHLWVGFREGALGDKTDSYILQGCYYHMKNYIRKTQDNAVLVSLSNPVGEDGTVMEDMIPSDGINPLEYMESRIDMEGWKKTIFNQRETTGARIFFRRHVLREIGRK